MKRKIVLIMMVLFSLTLLALKRQTGIEVQNLDSMLAITPVTSEDVLDMTSVILPRFLVETLDKMEEYPLTGTTADLQLLLNEIEPRYVIQSLDNNWTMMLSYPEGLPDSFPTTQHVYLPLLQQ